MKTKSELIKFMKNKLDKQNIKEGLWNNRQYTNLPNEEFKIVHSVGNFKRYYYYISNYGRVLIVDVEDNEPQKTLMFDSNLSNEKCQLIPIQNGYLDSKTKLKFDIPKLATETDVYKFTVEAGWLDSGKDAEIKQLAQKIVDSGMCQNDRLEVHHINNNPSDNSIENLIWLPRSIHQHLHNQE